ncbi:hypothetical protein Tco_1434261, partial [Tanacetum coccineum]
MDQEISIMPPTLGRRNQTLTGHKLKPSLAHKVKEKDKEEYEMETDMEVEEVIEEEKSEFKTDKEVEEIFKAKEEDEDDENFNSFPTMKELSHHEWLL